MFGMKTVPLFVCMIFNMLFSCIPVHANPVTYGEQLCVMLKSGIGLRKAWIYIESDYIKAAMANPQTIIPWYSAAAAGWALGTALGRADQAKNDLELMKPDIFKIAQARCPQYFNSTR
jgi:hypothetical protein